MKSLNFFTTLLLLATTAAAQPYGQQVYPTSSSMTSARRTIINGATNDGFIMAGIKGTNIHIDKTNTGGVLPGATGSNYFMRDYTAVENGHCGSTPGTPINPFNGVSISEVICTSGSIYYYAFASVYNAGVFVTFLQQDGTIIKTLTFPFPYTSNTLNKPVIYQHGPSKDIFITGSFDKDMYMIRIDNTGTTVFWSAFYNAGNATLMQPRDLVVNNSTNEVIIVGHMMPDFSTYGSASDAFFMSLNGTTGNVNNFRNYTSTPCNWFNSIKKMSSSTADYLVGGYTDPSLNTGAALMMKLGPSGNIIWNRLISSGASGILSGQIVEVAERQNTSGQWEMFGLAHCYNTNFIPTVSDLTVFKLDVSGNPAPGINEYHYSGNPGSQYIAQNLSFNNSGASDVGLHIFADNVGVGHHLTEAYFNGVTGCTNDDLTVIQAIEQGPYLVNMPVSKFGSLPMCHKVKVTEVPAGATLIQYCSSPSIATGSNAKEALATGISEGAKINGINIYPNPGNGNYNLDMDSPAKVTVVSVLGQQVFEEFLEAGTNRLPLENCKNGVYLVKISDGYNTNTLRIIKE